ncbi:MAG: FAD:protein FMN transferase, partial [Proteobacteria bacterium]|nr:FAD:protein FMN transferase [Pseudomonadota bacterium]
MNAIRRARPWLGTLVDIRVDGMESACALRAIDAAFAEVATVHRLMSFHGDDSDLARLRQAPACAAVRVNARTHEVLECALRIAAASTGIFDPTVAAAQVARGALPVPRSAFVPDADASWRDIELLGGERVRLRRPLWIDLGGIAKGYAVDRA